MSLIFVCYLDLECHSTILPFSCMLVWSQSPAQNINKAKGPDFAFANTSTRTIFLRSPFLSSIPSTTILKFLWSSFIQAPSSVSFSPPGGHPAQYNNYKARWNAYVMMPTIFSEGTPRRFFLADITYNGNSSQESEERRNDFSFLFFEERVWPWSHISTTGGRGHVIPVALHDCIRCIRAKLRFSANSCSGMCLYFKKDL